MDAEAVKALVKAAEGSDSVWVTGLALVILAVLVANRFGLFAFLSGGRTAVQATDFQQKLLDALEASHQREDAMARKLTEMAGQNDELRGDVQDARFEIHMLRQQVRLLLEWIKQLKAGVIGLDAPLPEISAPEAKT
ncbi:hypothetical protein [Methylopila sp. 73B]|uniref:hypothetical protein n=1 Tax=Methylopila sp. 73B TaxID=1120792 RepID=UPI000370E436|nr:hypothetical protein [Methylopila sp. 73B]